MNEKTDVLIVGAGPTGLTLAAGLLSRGVRVRVVDRAERASPHSKAITLWPRSFEVFETLGVGRELYDRSVKLAATNYYTGDRHIGRLRMRPLAGTRFPVPVSLPQVTTEEVLREAVGRHGCRIEFGSRLARLGSQLQFLVADQQFEQLAPLGIQSGDLFIKFLHFFSPFPCFLFSANKARTSSLESCSSFFSISRTRSSLP